MTHGNEKLWESHFASFDASLGHPCLSLVRPAQTAQCKADGITPTRFLGEFRV